MRGDHVLVIQIVLEGMGERKGEGHCDACQRGKKIEEIQLELSLSKIISVAGD